MPMLQHASAPVPLPRDDRPPISSPRSPPSYSPVLDSRPIVQHQPSRDSTPPSTKPESRPTTPQPTPAPSRTTPQPESPPQNDAKAEKAPVVEEPQEEDDEPEADDAEGPIDMETFQQILELDEEDDREFSREMVWAYFSQAEVTFGELDAALTKKDLTKLSHLGHFLKGSSAALGVSRVETACEKIQHYGLLRDEENNKDLTSETALELIKKTLVRVKKDYAVADKWLRKFYDEEN